MEPRTIRLHGHPVSYLEAGSGPPLVLIHGITSRARCWERVIPGLAEHHTVIAPDLLGHGGSAKPRGDYSLGAYASGVRDMLIALGHPRATVVGHSLGGGIAMQLAYQFPERVERLVLVSSGGLGRELNLMLRAAALPGSELVMPLIGRLGGTFERFGGAFGHDMRGILEGAATLHEREARSAFVHTVRAIADAAGQRIDATDRLYLAAALPVLVVWGDGDRIIPVAHGRAAQAAMPHSRLEIFEGAGHFPFNDRPDAFVAVLRDFIESTEPGEFDEERVRAMLLAGGTDEE